MKTGIISLCVAVAICSAGPASAQTLDDVISIHGAIEAERTAAGQRIDAENRAQIAQVQASIRSITAEFDRRAARDDAAYQAALKSDKCKHPIHIGMSDAEVVAAWCEPDHINSTVGITHNREQWVYRLSYLYFEDGRLIGIQRNARH